MTQSLPLAPHLEHLKRQAKALLVACRLGEPDALSRVLSHVISSDDPLRLADTQFVIAREHGFSSWPKLKKHLETLTPPPQYPPVKPLSRWKQGIKSLAEELVALAQQENAIGVSQRMACLPHVTEVRDWIVSHHPQVYTQIITLLLVGVGSENARMRFDCAGAMDHFADERCAQPLRRLANDPVPRVRRAALHSLACNECKVTPLSTCDDFVATFIDRVSHDPSIQVRRHAVWGLNEAFADPRAAAILEALLERETDAKLLRNVRRVRENHRRMKAKEE